jgi:hypothetical protein
VTGHVDPARRRLLKLLGAAGASVVLGPLAVTALADVLLSAEPERQLLDALRRRDATRRLGGAYLREHPDEASVAILRHLVFGQAGEGEPTSPIVRLRDGMRADFAASRTVRTDGWVLSRTEARLLALATLPRY